MFVVFVDWFCCSSWLAFLIIADLIYVMRHFSSTELFAFEAIFVHRSSQRVRNLMCERTLPSLLVPLSDLRPHYRLSRIIIHHWLCHVDWSSIAWARRLFLRDYLSKIVKQKKLKQHFFLWYISKLFFKCPWDLIFWACKKKLKSIRKYVRSMYCWMLFLIFQRNYMLLKFVVKSVSVMTGPSSFQL